MAAATTMEYTFVGTATIKRVIGDWNTDDVTTMEGMFAGEWADERKLKLEWGGQLPPDKENIERGHHSYGPCDYWCQYR